MNQIPRSFFNLNIQSPSTVIGRAGAPSNPDIQLSGVGIQNEHCVVEIKTASCQDDVSNSGDVIGTLTVTPCGGARTCVNGVEISRETPVRNGDRILCGSTHFFRVNCPKAGGKNMHTESADKKLKGLLLYGDSFVYINTVNFSSQTLYHSHMVCYLYFLLVFDLTYFALLFGEIS